jgi:hypothetical protein
VIVEENLLSIRKQLLLALAYVAAVGIITTFVEGSTL